MFKRTSAATSYLTEVQLLEGIEMTTPSAEASRYLWKRGSAGEAGASGAQMR